MSRFFSEKYSGVTPYTPGEQPRDQRYIKLNTNESPFPPSPLAQKYAAEEAGKLELYSDPTCSALVNKAAQLLGIDPEEIIFSNGSDESLYFLFMAFCDESCGLVCPDVNLQIGIFGHALHPDQGLGSRHGCTDTGCGGFPVGGDPMELVFGLRGIKGSSAFGQADA